jgi:guanylate kinase
MFLLLLIMERVSDMRSTGTAYVIAAASGTGKTSLAKALVSSLENLKISISHTTRPIKPGEQENVHYFFVQDDIFEQMIARNDFLEYAKVFNYYYGTSRSFMEEQLSVGNDVILDIDWQGAQQIKKGLDNCVSIFLLPPSKDVLRERLRARRRDTDDVIEYRLQMASHEISHYREFDYLVVNDDFDRALRELQSIVVAHRLRQTRQAIENASLLRDLLSGMDG